MFNHKPTAFAHPAALSRHPVHLRNAQITTLSPRRPRVLPIAPPSRRASVTMLGPFFPNLDNSKMLRSEVVRNEMQALERDYMEIAKLGARYEVRSSSFESHSRACAFVQP